MRITVSLSISCRKNVFLLKFSNKNTFFPHEMDKLTVVLMSIKRLNKERRPLVDGLVGKSNMHIRIDFCPRLARKEMNVSLH